MRMVRLLGYSMLVLLAGPIAAEEQAGADLPEMKRLRMNRDCIRINRIRDNYEFLDYNNMVVWTGRRNPYHVELSRSCQLANDIMARPVFRGRAGLLCGGPGDYILIRDVFGRRDRDLIEDRCSIRSVTALGEEGLYELMIEFNRAPPPPPIPPVEVEVLPDEGESETKEESEETQ